MESKAKPALRAAKLTIDKVTPSMEVDLTIPGYGYLQPMEVHNLILHHPESVFVLDVRDFGDAEESSNARKNRKFNHAFRQVARHIPMLPPGFEDQKESLARLATTQPAAWSKLLDAEYVIVHCDQGVQRSPLMVKALQERFATTPNARAKGQKVALMSGGFSFYSDEKNKSVPMEHVSVAFTQQEIANAAVIKADNVQRAMAKMSAQKATPTTQAVKKK